jgi:ribonuclease P protein subunit RPR2
MNKNKIKEIAEKRVRILFELAEKEVRKENFGRAKRYVELARKIGIKAQYTLPKELKRKFCKKCNYLLIPGKTCLVRLDKKTRTVNIKCFNCNNIKRYKYGK